MRNYKRKTTQHQWSAESMKSAIRSVRTGILSQNEAARQFGIPVATLHRRIKSGKNEEEASRKKLGRFKTVFSLEQEKALFEHLTRMDKLFFGLSHLELRSLAFQYAEINKIPNNFNKQNCLAGKDWLYIFLKRHPQLILTTAARGPGFNKVGFETFFTLLAELQDKYALSASRIYNCDETGITTDPNKPTKIISVKGKKQVGNFTSGETDTLITAEICVSASGHYIPPLLIIPHQRRNAIHQVNLPPGSIVIFHKSGWMQTEIMSDIWFPHFLKHTHPSVNDPVLLILDGHSTHVKNLALIETARQHHVHILAIPPHTSHKLQPLEVSFMYPLCNYYTQEVRNWQRDKPNKLVELQDVVQIFSKAYARAARPSNAENGFKSTGIFPHNNKKFADIDFAPSQITERENIFKSTPDNFLARASVQPEKMSCEPLDSCGSISQDELDTKQEIGWDQGEDGQPNFSTLLQRDDWVLQSSGGETMIDTKEISELDIKEEIVEEHDEDESQSHFTLKRKRNDEFLLSSSIETDTKENLQKNNESMEDEYDVFSKDIAAQLRQLPARSFIMLKEKIQELITREKLNSFSSNSKEIHNWIKTENE